jgi:hypothetical protein
VEDNWLCAMDDGWGYVNELVRLVEKPAGFD